MLLYFGEGHDSTFGRNGHIWLFQFSFRTENIFHIINRNIKNPIILQAIVWYPWDNILITWMQLFTYSGSDSASVMVLFSSYNNAVYIS